MAAPGDQLSGRSFVFSVLMHITLNPLPFIGTSPCYQGDRWLSLHRHVSDIADISTSAMRRHFSLTFSSLLTPPSISSSGT